MAVTQISNIAGAFGLSSQPDWQVEEIVSGEASTTIAKGDGVAATTVAGQALQCTTVAGQGLQLLGVAPAAILAGKVGLVMTKGRAANLATADYASPTVGDVLTTSTATAGRLAALSITSATQGRAIGVVLQTRAQAAGLTVADVYIQKM